MIAAYPQEFGTASAKRQVLANIQGLILSLCLVSHNIGTLRRPTEWMEK